MKSFRKCSNLSLCTIRLSMNRSDYSDMNYQFHRDTDSSDSSYVYSFSIDDPNINLERKIYPKYQSTPIKFISCIEWFPFVTNIYRNYDCTLS